MQNAIRAAAAAIAILSPVLRAGTPNAAVDGNQRLVGRLYAGVRGVSGKNPNFVIGVAGVSAAMALTVAGAEGETRDELLRALGWTRATGDSRAWQAWLSGMAGGGANAKPTWTPLQLRIGVWARDLDSLKPAFVSAAHDTFGATVKPMTGDPHAVANAINAWMGPGAAEAHVVEPDAVGSGDVVVASSTALKLNWLAPFDPSRTTQEPFHASPSRAQRVPMMHARVTDCLYVEAEKWRTLVLPLWGRGLSFGLAVPNNRLGLEPVERELVTAGVQGLLNGERVRDPVDLTLPPFSVTGRYNLVQVFRRMGVRKALTPGPGGADFGGIDDTGLWLGKTVMHVASLTIDPAGAQARVWLAADDKPSSPAVPFRVDRPFLFWLTQTDTGATLFVGRVGDLPPTHPPVDSANE